MGAQEIFLTVMLTIYVTMSVFTIVLLAIMLWQLSPFGKIRKTLRKLISRHDTFEMQFGKIKVELDGIKEGASGTNEEASGILGIVRETRKGTVALREETVEMRKETVEMWTVLGQKIDSAREKSELAHIAIITNIKKSEKRTKKRLKKMGKKLESQFSAMDKKLGQIVRKTNSESNNSSNSPS